MIDGLNSESTEARLQAVIRAGKIKDETLPIDVRALLLDQLNSSDEDLQAEAIRTLGIHWTSQEAVSGIASLLIQSKGDRVKLGAITALGALGKTHAELKEVILRMLAGFVNGQHKEALRVVAYLEMLVVAGRISFEEYIERDRDLPDTLAEVEVDTAWLRRLANGATA